MTDESTESQSGAKAAEQAASESASAGAVGTAGTVGTAEMPDALKRLSPWESSGAALGYVLESSRTDAIQLRTSDRVTIIALLVCCILEVLSLSYSPLSGMRLPIIIFCDVVLGVSTMIFLIYRLGILRSLSPRQALVCWQLMMGCIFFGVFLCINMGVAVAFMVTGGGNSSDAPIESPVDPPTP